MAFHPYLFFGGNCRDAFTRYQQIFGGDVTLLTSKDMPGEEQMPGASEDTIMHAALMVDGNLLMGSDDPMADPFGPVQGIQVNFNTPDVAEAKRVFEALSARGKVNMPIEATSWSPAFGMCIDEFGTPWMISADSPS